MALSVALKARGNFEVAIQWSKGSLVTATILSVMGGRCNIRTSAPIRIAGTAAQSVKDAFGYITSINMRKGTRYALSIL